MAKRMFVMLVLAAVLISGLGVFYAGNAFSTPRSRDGVPGRYLGTDLVAAAELVGSVIH